MGYYFKSGWEPQSEFKLTEEMAKEFVQKLFSPQAPQVNPSLAPSSTQAIHIGEYIEHMMNELNYKLLDLTITKDNYGDIVFEVINKEK